MVTVLMFRRSKPVVYHSVNTLSCTIAKAPRRCCDGKVVIASRLSSAYGRRSRWLPWYGLGTAPAGDNKLDRLAHIPLVMRRSSLPNLSNGPRPPCSTAHLSVTASCCSRQGRRIRRCCCSRSRATPAMATSPHCCASSTTKSRRSVMLFRERATPATTLT